MWYNVKTMYGADNAGNIDSTTVIQNAINAAHNAGGGVVYFQPGTYKISAPLVVYGGIQIRGDGDANTVINQTSSGSNCFTGTDLNNFKVSNIQLSGPAAGTGKGIQLGLSSHASTGFLHFEDVFVQKFGGDAIDIDTPMASVFDRIITQSNNGNGWNTHSSTYGDSCVWNACFSKSNGLAGFTHTNLNYSDMNGCASDGNAQGIVLTNCQSVVINGPGAESNTGDNFTISGGFGNVLVSPRVFQNANYGIRLTANAKNCSVIAAVDIAPLPGAVAFVITDAGTTCSVMNINNTSPLTFNGSVTVLNDGSGDISAPGLITAYGGIDTTGLSTSAVAKTGAYTLTGTDSTILANANSAAFSVTLPSAAAAGIAGQIYTVKKIDASANVVTVATQSSQTIDGKPNATLTTQYNFVMVQSDGANWQIIGGIAVGATGPQGPVGPSPAQIIDVGDNAAAWSYVQGNNGFMPTTAQGNPGTSYLLSNSNFTVGRNIGPQAHYQFDCYIAAGGWINFYFGCNSAGAGYMSRIDTRSGQPNGISTATAWNTFSGVNGALPAATAGVWHTVTVDVGSNLLTMKVDGVIVYSGNLGGTIAPMGNYIGMSTAATTSYFDNIYVGYSGPVSSPLQAFDIADSAAAWNYGAGNAGFAVSGAQGNPGNSYIVPAAVVVTRNIGAQTHYQFDCYIPANLLCDFYFGCNALGAGYIARVDSRAGTNCGVGTTTSWGAFAGIVGSANIGPVTSGVWHTVTIDVGINLITMKIDGILAHSGNMGGTVNSMGAFIGLSSETGSCYFDNIGIGYSSPPASQLGVLWYNVKTMFGADPTGNIDATAAINNAIVAANATGYGGTVYLPPGWYKISSPINFNNCNFVELRGDGTASRLQPTAAFAGAAAIISTGGGRNAVNNFLIQFTTAWNTNPVADGIQVVHSPYFQTTNVEVLAFNGYGISVICDATGGSSWAHISRLFANGCKGGINLQGSAGVSTTFTSTINECNLVNCQASAAINIQDAIHVEVDNCIIWGNQGNGIVISGVSTNIFIEGTDVGSYSGTTGSGLLVQNTGANNPGDIYISNSYFAGGLYAGLIAAGARIYATNCVFGWAQSHGLYFSGVATTTFVTLTNCLFTTNGRTAGTCYELFWAGSGIINVIGCQFGTWVNTTPTAGYVAATMNFTAGTSTVSDCQILNNVAPGTGTYAGRPTYSVNNYGEPTSNFPAVRAGGIAGTTNATRYVGATGGGGPPGSGTFAVGDFVVDPQGQVYICTVAGSPGTWTGTGPYTVFAYANPNYTVPADNLPHNIVGAVVTVNVQPGWEVLVNYSSFGLIGEANAAAHAILSCNLFLDGAAAPGVPAGMLSARNASIGYAAMISNIWKFTGLSAGSHTIQLVCQFNGTTSAAIIQQSSISATVSRPPM
jgi:hypothetical protein